MYNSRFLPYLLIVSAGIIWGATFSLALIATAEGAHPVAITAWQVLVTGMIFLIVCVVSSVSLFQLKNLRHYLVLAVVGICAPSLFYYYGASHLSAGILSITIATVPLFTYLIMIVLRYESLIIKRVSGIVFGLIAILLLVLPDQGLESDDASLWILLVVLSAILYSIETVYLGKGIPRHVDIRELLFSSNLIAFILLFPMTIIMGTGESVDWLVSDAGLAVVGMAVISGVAYSIFFYVVKTSGPVFASQCAYVITISGVIWGILLFSEQHTLWVWSSVVVMMLGLVLVTPDSDLEENIPLEEAEAASKRY